MLCYQMERVSGRPIKITLLFGEYRVSVWCLQTTGYLVRDMNSRVEEEPQKSPGSPCCLQLLIQLSAGTSARIVDLISASYCCCCARCCTAKCVLCCGQFCLYYIEIFLAEMLSLFLAPGTLQM